MKTDITIRSVNPSEKMQWNSIATHPLQSWEWGEFRERMGIDVVRLGVYKNNTLTDIIQLTFHKIPYTPFTIGYFPKGSIPTPEMIDSLQKIGKEKKAIYIQLEPNCTELQYPLSSIKHLRQSHHPMFTKHTFIIDCTKSEEELLKDMHSKTRYNIKVAIKKGVTTREDNSDDAFDSYEKLSDETTSRQGFFAHNHIYHKTVWSMLHKAGIAKMFISTYKNKTLAAWMLFVWNKRVYYPYGASSREHRDVMAPTLLLWEIVKWAKKEGFTSFDLWGALGPDPDPNDPWYGFHKFKQGFNPSLITYVGSYDLVIQPILYKLFIVADTIRWFVLKRIR